jgi:hypothetical protein
MQKIEKNVGEIDKNSILVFMREKRKDIRKKEMQCVIN